MNSSCIFSSKFLSIKNKPRIESTSPSKPKLKKNIRPILTAIFTNEFNKKFNLNNDFKEKHNKKSLKLEELTSFFYRTTSNLKEKIKSEITSLGTLCFH
jgi:hypothetical protein